MEKRTEALSGIKGLAEYVTKPFYRKSLGLPKGVEEEYSLLAQGEYNRNYQFTHPVTGQRLVLRVNCGSQMHLKRQIDYEYKALCLLAPSGRTPRPFYVDGSLLHIPHGILVMEWLPGSSLDYRKAVDLNGAASCLADIHSMKVVEGCGLLQPKDPLRAVLEECESMVQIYMDWGQGDPLLKKRLRSMLDLGWKRLEHGYGAVGGSIINTELNSTNFLMNGSEGTDYLVDWEKPLLGDPAQDLGHFLAPTTTFWKTDVIFTHQEMEQFLERYIEYARGRMDVKGLRERVYAYIPITCLRGITWCAMAWVEYHKPDRLLINPSTLDKLGQYLDQGFLDGIDQLLREDP